MSKLRLTACPICGGKLQATELRERYFDLDYVEVDTAFRIEPSERAACEHFRGDGDVISYRIYCENDCDKSDMEAEAIKQFEASQDCDCPLCRMMMNPFEED